MSSLTDIADFVSSRERFLVTSHARPDGDSIGSELALWLALRQMGKSVEIVNKDPCPPNYASLPSIEQIQLKSRVDGHYDALIVLECANLERTGLEGLEPFDAVNIDHHPVNDGFGIHNWIDPKAGAVAEMLFCLLQELGATITPDIATNLYTGILTDTGSFHFPNTTAESFRIAGRLVEAGADPARIAESVLMRQSEARLRLISRLLETLEIDETRRIASLILNQEMLAETGAAKNDTEGLVNYPLSVDGVLLCAFFREEEEGRIRVSLRSKGDLDVGLVAERFGGGGHKNAAGLTIEGTFDEARERVLDHLARLLRTSAS